VGAFAGGATEALGAAIVNVCMAFPLALDEGSSKDSDLWRRTD